MAILEGEVAIRERLVMSWSGTVPPDSSASSIC